MGIFADESQRKQQNLRFRQREAICVEIKALLAILKNRFSPHYIRIYYAYTDNFNVIQNVEEDLHWFDWNHPESNPLRRYGHLLAFRTYARVLPQIIEE
jgi:hypothetical protein